MRRLSLARTGTPSHADLGERTLVVKPLSVGRYETRWKDGGDTSGPPPDR